MLLSEFNALHTIISLKKLSRTNNILQEDRCLRHKERDRHMHLVKEAPAHRTVAYPLVYKTYHQRSEMVVRYE